MSKGKIPIIMKSNSIFNILKGSERSVKAKRNILEMFLLKGGNILIGLIVESKWFEKRNSPKRSIFAV